MDRNSLEDSKLVKAAAGAAALLICAGIGLRLAFNRSLTEVRDSLARSFVVVEHVDGIVDDLDRLSIDQRALLSIGGDRFSEGVAESVTGIIAHVDALQQLRLRDPAMKRQIGRISQSVDWVLDLVGKSNDLQELFGVPVALALLDTEGDSSILAAKSEAMRLKNQATDQLLYGIGEQRELRSVLEVLF